MASMSWAAAGRLCGRQIMSPREMSTSSSSSSVTDIGANASRDLGPGRLDHGCTLVANPDGRCSTSSPGLSTPPATWPA